jgi:hypothetical protein
MTGISRLRPELCQHPADSDMVHSGIRKISSVGMAFSQRRDAGICHSTKTNAFAYSTMNPD